MPRMFVGLPLTKEASRGVKNVVKQLARSHYKLEYEPEEKWHVTLAYLGEIDSFDESLLGELSFPSFMLSFKGLGAFPDLMLPRVVWMGLRGELKSLHLLRKQVVSMLEANYWVDQRKPFHPHITLARVKESCGRKERLELGKYITKHRILDIPQHFEVVKLCVYCSELTETGSRYSFVGEILLT